METKQEYTRLRKAGWTAHTALRAAKIRTRFAALEHAGIVRFDVLEDSEPYMHGDVGDESETNARIERDGLYGIQVSTGCEACGSWNAVDAVWGFIGNDWRDSGYDVDLMESAIESVEKSTPAGHTHD
jgi:hypothetical protein